jgi:ribosome modulation factor
MMRGNPMNQHAAYDEGYDAYWQGLPRDDNPYDQQEAPDEYQFWDEGWRAARIHDYDESDG